MKTLTAAAIVVIAVGCGQTGHTEHGSKQKQELTKCERLEIWRAVLISSAFAKQTSKIIKFETGRDEYDQIFGERLSPTLKRFGLDRIHAVLIFSEEGGWPYDP